MRFRKEIENKYCRTQLFNFNNKYVIKFEVENLEQIYKFSEQDIINHDELENLLTDTFMARVIDRFRQMNADYDDIMDQLDAI
jgi:hypothetical protein